MTGGLSAAGLRRLHDVLARHVDDGAPPGLVAAVSRGDQVHVEALGTTTDGGSEPVREDTLFRISSLTKPVTAAATMALVEECRLRLEDPVDPLLPSSPAGGCCGGWTGRWTTPSRPTARSPSGTC